MPQLNGVDYWSIISHPQLNWIALLGFIVISLFILVRLWSVLRKAYWFILIVAIFSLCAISFWNALADTRSSTTIEDVMSVQYAGKPYHLAFSTYQRPWDISNTEYYVFECDEFDHNCSLIYYEPADRTYAAKISVSDNKLIYERDTVNYQILPAKSADAG